MQRTRQTPNRIPLLPIPTLAQCTYGALTVVFSTVAMLLLSQTVSGAWIAVIACAALGLGLLVAMTVPMPAQLPGRARRWRRHARETARASAPVPAPGATYDGVRVPGPRARTSARTSARTAARTSVGEHSLPG